MPVDRFLRRYLASLAAHGIGKGQAAALAGMKQPVMSRLLNAERPVYADHLAAMLRALPKEDREACLIDWILGQCPEEYQGRLSVSFGKPVEQKVTPILDELGRALVILEDEATTGRNTALRRTLINLSRMVSGHRGAGTVEEPDAPPNPKQTHGGGPAASVQTA